MIFCSFFDGWCREKSVKALARCLLMAMIASLTSDTLKIHNKNSHSMFFNSRLEHLCASSSMSVLLPKAAFAFASLHTTGSSVHFRGKSFLEHPLSSKPEKFRAAILETPDDGMQAETVHTILVDKCVESVHHEATRLHLSTLKAKSDNIASNIVDESHLVRMSLRCKLRSGSKHPTSSKTWFPSTSSGYASPKNLNNQVFSTKDILHTNLHRTSTCLTVPYTSSVAVRMR